MWRPVPLVLGPSHCCGVFLGPIWWVLLKSSRSAHVTSCVASHARQGRFLLSATASHMHNVWARLHCSLAPGPVSCTQRHTAARQPSHPWLMSMYCEWLNSTANTNRQHASRPHHGLHNTCVRSAGPATKIGHWLCRPMQQQQTKLTTEKKGLRVQVQISPRPFASQWPWCTMCGTTGSVGVLLRVAFVSPTAATTPTEPGSRIPAKTQWRAQPGALRTQHAHNRNKASLASNSKKDCLMQTVFHMLNTTDCALVQHYRLCTKGIPPDVPGPLSV